MIYLFTYLLIAICDIYLVYLIKIFFYSKCILLISVLYYTLYLIYFVINIYYIILIFTLFIDCY